MLTDLPKKIFLVKSTKENCSYYNSPIDVYFRTSTPLKFIEKTKGTYLIFYNTEGDFKPELGNKYKDKPIWIRVRNKELLSIRELSIDEQFLFDQRKTKETQKNILEFAHDTLQDIIDPDEQDPNIQTLDIHMTEIKEELKIAETEEEAMVRIKNKFQIQDQFLDGVARGIVKALIVSGPAGVGKSHKIKQKLKDAEQAFGFKSTFIKGIANPLYIYKVLYEHRNPKDVVVFDDCDGIFKDHQALNIFKGALDTSKDRIIAWGVAKSNILSAEGIPTQFSFQGSIIFITNVKLKNTRSEELREHLKALESRCHYLDLSLDTDEDKFRRIEQVVAEENMLREVGLTEEQIQEILEFVKDNIKILRELSLRTIVKIADLIRMYPDSESWKGLARETCFKSKC